MSAPPGTHRRYDLSTAAPAAYRGIAGELFRGLCRLILFVGRWKIAGDWPAHPKMVVVAAPHTSNWDGIWMLAAAGCYRVTLRWMGKKSLTEGPFGGFVKWAGCVPIDRSKSNDVVQAMADAFAGADRMLLAVPPEGTRAATREWKSGFYHIARLAGVPLVLAVMDYRTRTVRISGEFWLTGDYAADLEIIKTHYAGAQGKHEEKFVVAS